MSSRFSLVAAILIALSYHASAQNKWTGPFTLTVDLSHTSHTNGKLYLSSYNPVTKVHYNDSAEISNKSAIIKGTLPEPGLFEIRISPTSESHSQSKNTLSLYLQPGDIKIQVKDSLSNSTISGDPLQQDYLTLQKKVDKKTTAQGQDSVYKAYITENHDRSPVVLYALTQFAGMYPEPSKVQPVFSQLSATFQNLPTGQKFTKLLAIALTTEVGQLAQDFTQPDTLGTPITLSSFKGKYVLLDFWASWCGPCRMQNPNIVKAWQQYKDKGFTVLSVSLDRPGDRDKWLKAIHHDNLTWTHVSDLQYWNNTAAKAYGIQAIPQNFLLDKEGRIIAKDLRDDQLAKKLATLLD